MESDPDLRPEPLAGDADRALRPQTLDEFIGQREARSNLKVFIESAKMRGEAMDHVLFHGPPGLGKDHACADYGPRVGCELSHDLWACIGQGGGFGGDPDEFGSAGCSVY